VANQRINESFLALKERDALLALVRRLPDWATPDQLTAIGLCGAGLTLLGFIGCRWSDGFLVAVVGGLFLNWFGDSLDGTLARYRAIERPHYGYFIDHSSDLIAQTLIVVGLGVSPYFTVGSSLLVLSLYLLMSSYTYLRVVTERVHRLAYGGMGATEFRLLVAAWALFAAWLGPSVPRYANVWLRGSRRCHWRTIRSDLPRLRRGDSEGSRADAARGARNH
jgi:phosphatidylglycerophosphate synthase